MRLICYGWMLMILGLSAAVAAAADVRAEAKDSAKKIMADLDKKFAMKNGIDSYKNHSFIF